MHRLLQQYEIIAVGLQLKQCALVVQRIILNVSVT